jgi:phosphinothricin acetyltransferase
MPSSIQLRQSQESNIPAITEIYADHVLHGGGSFEIEPPDVAEMARRRLEVVSRGLPYLVAVEGDRVIGYAYAGMYRPRLAYRFTLEDSVYVHRDYIGRGIGLALLERLIPACREWGCRQLIAVIGDSGNTASIRLHERLGFKHVGILQEVGFKFDRWLDTVFMQLSL